jgi:hypothetical protein
MSQEEHEIRKKPKRVGRENRDGTYRGIPLAKLTKDELSTEEDTSESSEPIQ